MFQRNVQLSAVVSGILTVLVTCGMSGALLHAQQAAPTKQQKQPRPPQKPSKELWQLLADWSKASDNIQKLHGKHERHSYDRTFHVEKVAHGEFWHEAPDKGRIDVHPVKITPKMLADRKNPKAQVERKSDGTPYDLQSDDAERWICDGTRVFDIDERQKAASVAQLPPEVRGTNIINSPLPFLFGLPPQKAIERFDLTIVKDWRPKHQLVQLRALPRTRQDAQNWSEAIFLLDTKTYLPTAVKLVDPAGTKDTVYKFKNMEINKNGIIEKLLGKNPWDPRLGRDYQVHMIGRGSEQPVAQNAPAMADQKRSPVIPNVIGMNHHAATKSLLKAGVSEKKIRRLNAGNAPNTDLTYTVQNQNPPPNTPVGKVTQVVLKIYDKAQPVKQ